MKNLKWLVFKHIIVWLTLKIPLQILGYVVLALYLPLTLRDKRSHNCEDQRLPYLLRWFDNGDNRDQKYGLNGDIAHQKRHKSLFVRRYTWLATRNPVNYFQRHILGYFLPFIATYHKINEPKYTSPIAASKKDTRVGDYVGQSEGFRFVRAYIIVKGDISHKLVWEYYRIKHYGNGKCLRIRIGYKLGHDPLEKGPDTLQWVLSISPWKTYRGIKE